MSENVVFRGDRLKKLRKDNDLSQEELAAKLSTPTQEVTQTHISRWESGQYNPLADTIVRIADYFRVTTDYLLGVVTAQNGRSEVRDQSEVERRIAELVEEMRKTLQSGAAGNEGGNEPPVPPGKPPGNS